MAVSAKTEFDIAAPLSVVMEVLMDIESLPEWSGPHKAAQIVSTHDDGTPDEVKANQKVIDAYLGVAHDDVTELAV